MAPTETVAHINSLRHFLPQLVVKKGGGGRGGYTVRKPCSISTARGVHLHLRTSQCGFWKEFVVMVEQMKYPGGLSNLRPTTNSNAEAYLANGDMMDTLSSFKYL